MAQNGDEISDYRRYIEAMLLPGENVEAVFQSQDPDDHDPSFPPIAALTTARLMVLRRRFGTYGSARMPGVTWDEDEWQVRTIPFSTVLQTTFGIDAKYRSSESEILAWV